MTRDSRILIRADFVQELYLRELKSFKPTPQVSFILLVPLGYQLKAGYQQAKDAHVGQVKEFHSPASPAKPESLSSADLAKELDAYDASVRLPLFQFSQRDR